VFFVVISGVIRKNKKLSVFALICLVFQSGLIWGVFPLEESISWESHLMGGIVGSFLAIAYRHQGPQNHEPIYEGEASAQEDEYLNL
jgi:membrane associated rhomboid family serine protease